MDITINDGSYSVRGLTRGEVRRIGELEGEEQSDELVRLTLAIGVDIDDIPMRDFMDLVAWAIEYNGLDKSAVPNAKKN